MTRDDLALFTTVRIASPCPVKWGDMSGDERKRFCASCKLHVYRLSELSTDEAVELVKRSRVERVCGQLFYRLDGTVMTKDCPSAWKVGVAMAKQRVEGRKTPWALATFVVLAVGFAVITLFGDNIRASFGASTGGALAGEEQVQRRVHTGVLKSFAHADDTY